MQNKVAKKLIFYLIILASIIFCELYSLGVFDIYFIKNINEKNYSLGDFSYTGSLLDGKFHGEGKILFSDGNVYSGIFKKGKFSGTFSYLDKDNNSLEGVFENNKVVEGSLSTNGYQATINSDNTVEYIHNKSWSYTGEFDSTGQQGSGIFKWEDGSKYKGNFMHGLCDKDGTYYSKGNEILYKGALTKGLFNGFGKYNFNSTQYIGDFEDGLPNGKGTYKSASGWTYEGNFKEGVFDGEGIITDANGNKTSGKWNQGQKVS